MSAVASVSNPAAVSSRRLSELESSREISRITSSALDVTAMIESIGYLALRVHGVKRVQIKYTETSAPLVWGAHCDETTVASAVASISADGQVWGELRLYFDLQPSALESPLRFAKFVAQQVAIQLNRWSLNARTEDLRTKIERLRKIIEKRKAIQRARAILANSRRVTDSEALRLMRGYAEDSGRSLHQVAEAFIFGDAQKWVQGSRYIERKRPLNVFSVRARRSAY